MKTPRCYVTGPLAWRRLGPRSLGPMSASSSRWDRQAILSGIGVCLILAVPMTLIAAVVDSDDAGTNAFFFFTAVLGFILGTGCAAWVQDRGTPLSHAVLTGLAAYFGAQFVFVTIALLRGADVNWFGIFFTFSLVVLSGVIGGILGSRLQARGFVPSSRKASR